MMRVLGWTLFLFMTALGVAHGVPARPLYVPEPTPKAPLFKSLDLRGTTWSGKDAVPNYVIVFMPDGTLQYGIGKVTVKTGKASWKLEGDHLYFEMNNQYREFKGKVVGDLIVGDSWNKAGKTWKTELRRDSSLK